MREKQAALERDHEQRVSALRNKLERDLQDERAEAEREHAAQLQQLRRELADKKEKVGKESKQTHAEKERECAVVIETELGAGRRTSSIAHDHIVLQGGSADATRAHGLDFRREGAQRDGGEGCEGSQGGCGGSRERGECDETPKVTNTQRQRRKDIDIDLGRNR